MLKSNSALLITTFTFSILLLALATLALATIDPSFMAGIFSGTLGVSPLPPAEPIAGLIADTLGINEAPSLILPALQP